MTDGNPIPPSTEMTQLFIVVRVAGGRVLVHWLRYYGRRPWTMTMNFVDGLSLFELDLDSVGATTFWREDLARMTNVA